MKRMLTRVLRPGLSMLLVFCLMLGMCGAAFAAEGEGPKNIIKYVSLGDSMTNGYGLTGYDDPYKVNGFLDDVAGAYPAQFAAWLVENGYADEVELSQLAISAMRAEDLHFILEYPNGYEGDQYTEDEFVNNRFNDYYGIDDKLDDVESVAEIFQSRVRDADIISFASGNANFGVFLLGRITNALGVLGDNAEGDTWIEFQNALALCDADSKAIVMEAYNTALELLEEQLAANSMEAVYPLVEQLANVIGYTVASYVLNVNGALDAIAELNDGADIIIVGIMNTMSGLDVSYSIEGVSGTIDMGTIMAPVIESVNFYLAALPAAKQALGHYADHNIYYAEASNVEMLVSTYKTEISGVNVIRDRFIEEVCDVVWEKLDMNLPTITRADVEKFEADRANYISDPDNLAKANAIAIYLGFEDAILKATEMKTLDASAFLALTDEAALEATFDGVKTALGTKVPELMYDGMDYYSATTKALSTELKDSDVLMSLLNLFARMLIGNGIGCHPSEAGHDTLTEAIASVYENEVTAEDAVIEKVEIALNDLYYILEQYGPEAAELAWQYAVDNGYIETIETVIEELKTSLEAEVDAYIEEAIPAIEAAIEALEGEAEALKTELEGLKTALEAKVAELEAELAAAGEETAASIEAAIAEIEATIAQIEAAIVEVEAALAEIDAAVVELETALADIETAVEEMEGAIANLGDSVANLVDVLANATEATVESAAAAIEAAKAAVDSAIELVETAENALSELLGTVVDLTGAASEAVSAAGENALAILAELAETLIGGPVEDITAAVEELTAAAEAEIEALMAEYAEEIAAAEAVLAEIAAAIEAEVAVAIEAIKAEYAAEIAELEAAIEAKKAEIEAGITELEAELEAKKAELESAAEEVKAEIEAEIAAIEEAIAAKQAELENAVAELEAEIATIETEIETAIAEAKAEIEAAYAEAKAEAEAKIAEIEATIEEAKAVIEAELEAAIAELEAVAEGAAAVVEEVIAAVEAAVEEAKVAVEEIYGQAIVTVEDAIAAAEALANDVVAAIQEKIDEIVAAWDAAYADATTDDYTVTPDSYYVAIGDSSAVSESYVDSLAAYLGVDYNNLAKAGLEVEDAYGVVAENADEIAKADLITLGFSNATFVAGAVKSALLGSELDWSTYVTADGVAYVDAALAAVSGYLAENGITGETNAKAIAAIESYAYSTVAYACNMPELVNAIRGINTEATVIIVGQYNPFKGSVISIDGVEIDLGEYVDYLVDAAAVHGTAYCMITGNAIYVDAPNADTDVPAELNFEELVDMMISGGLSALYPNATGHEYIRNQILEALGYNVGGLLGDANSDGVVNTLDARLILLYNANPENTINNYDINLSVCDVSGDGKINTIDARWILMYNANPNTVFPAA